jgi:hypothetical protein
MAVGKLQLALTAEQTVQSIGLSGAAGADGFTFTAPGGGKKGSQLGDASIRVRQAGGTAPAPWSAWLTSGASPVPSGACSTLPCRANLTFQSRPDVRAGATGAKPPPVAGHVPPFSVLREWESGPNGELRLVFKVTNTGAAALEIGGLGITMPFAWAAGSAAGDLASTFLDPAITGQHGYATVTRLSGKREVLMVTTGVDAARCKGGLPGCRTSLEAWEDQSAVIGEWLCHTKAYSADWANASKSWLPPTSLVLEAGAAVDFVLLFSVAEDIRSKDRALSSANTAIVSGVPGYILGADMTTAQLLVKPPPGVKLLSAKSDTRSALIVGAIAAGAADGWVKIPVRATADGRPRVTLEYSDKSQQVINYRTLPPFSEHIDTYGAFQADTAFFTAEDAFRRSPSFMPFDRELNKSVINDKRTFVVGLSDDAGGGANEGYASKMRYRPTQHELEKLDFYINSTLWGMELDSAGVPVSLQDHSSHGVRSSMFWIALPKTNETGEPGYHYTLDEYTGWIWDRARGDSLGRAYNYPHQTTCYWAMYHALRDNDKLQASNEWHWYLDQAAKTITAMWQQARWYSQQGLMAGSVFKAVLEDLIAEQHPLAPAVREILLNRTMVGVTYYSAGSCNMHGNTNCPCHNCTHGTGNTTTDCPDDPSHARKITKYHCISWAENPFPFGSEFSWDSTGQEEDYILGRYFGETAQDRDGKAKAASADALANLTLSAVLAYVPSTPHWAYNGAALSWGDTGNNAKWPAAGRIAGHYRTTLNALPMMHEYMTYPDDLYLLGPTVGAASLHMATIDSRGAASMGFHLAPKHLKLDPYSGDFGVGFFGHAQLATSIFIVHPEHGPLCYFCDATSGGGEGGDEATAAAKTTTIVPRDSIRRRVFIEPLGVLIQVMAGALQSVAADVPGRSFSLLLKDDGLASKFRILISTPSLQRPGVLEGGVSPVKPLQKERGAYELPVAATATVDFKIGGKQHPLKLEAERSSSNSPWLGPGTAASAAAAATAVTAAYAAADPTCKMDIPVVLPDQAHPQMQLAGAPDLAGFEGGFAASNSTECSRKCAAQTSADGWHRLACQAWTFVEAAHSPKASQAWCWLRGGRGNAVGKCGYTSATCDNRPAPATDWPCCPNGFTCPDPFVPPVDARPIDRATKGNG